MNIQQLNSWQEFFNYEAIRIVELNPANLQTRIEDYSKLLSAVKAFQHACITRLTDIVCEERKRVLIEELKFTGDIPKSPAGPTKKSERISKQERAMKDAAKLLGISVEQVAAMGRDMQRENYKKIDEVMNVKCDKCGCTKCNDCGDCHICLSIVDCIESK